MDIVVVVSYNITIYACIVLLWHFMQQYNAQRLYSDLSWVLGRIRTRINLHANDDCLGNEKKKTILINFATGKCTSYFEIDN